jgi:cell division protein FtsW (lipid II flippase)
MAVSYTTARERDARRGPARQLRRPAGDMRLAAVSVLAVMAVLIAGAGRLRSLTAAGLAPLNLNTVADAAAIDAALVPALDHPADRALAAGEIFGFIVQAEGGRREMPNVGALSRVSVPAEVIDGTERAAAFRERLRQARESAAAAQRPAPTGISALTGAQLAAVKPALAVRTSGGFRRALFLWTAIYILAFHAVAFFWRRRGIRGDPVLLIALHGLTALGLLAMIARPDPLRDMLLFERYSLSVAIGLVALAALSALGARVKTLQEFHYVALGAALVLSLVLILFGSGPAGSDARVNLGPVQPIEAIRLLLAIFLAGYFARRWELLRGVRAEQIAGRAVPRWLNLPRAAYVAPVMLGVAASLALFFFQKDLGPALVIALVFLSLYVVARGSYVLAALGLALLVGGFYAGYQLNVSATVVDRVYMWQSPWDNIARRGDQVAQAMWALAAGGFGGTGLGLGDTRYLPAGHTDLVVASIGEELGFLGILIAGLLYAAVIWRGFTIARRASSDFAFFLAVAITLLIAVPVLLMLAGTLGAVPLTGVVTPFLSYGGSAMLAGCAALGLLIAIRADEPASNDLALFGRPLRVLGLALASAAAVLVLMVIRVQVLQADEVLVRPQLGVQADGTRRFQYNPRILDVARTIPRGSIFDREGLPLATDDRAVVKKAAGEYQRLGIAGAGACADAGARCYPLGGRAYHLLGDADARVNWSASNTSFAERDEESALRGFDDHQTIVRTTSVSGEPLNALRRDYRALVPLFRHRYDPDHAEVRAILERNRDLRLTIDARLQHRAAGIVADYASRAGAERGAAVVIDTATGDLLASVSYPWPDRAAGAASDERLLDRARYGLYPPGSTFKLITAAAALRQDPGLANAMHTCVRLPDGRVGAAIRGWSRPIRDDVLDTQPHGSIRMHQALVVSCNAYFANLAVELGAERLIETAERAELSVARRNDAARVRDTLPQAGYGQGDVLASPLRMARVGAALAGDGSIRDVRINMADAAPAPQPFLDPTGAATLGRYMRDAVLSGTGRSLRGHPARIAGKTGTAEVAGAPSHSWFVGFAPYGTASKRVAVAVIIENAGYGAAAAVPAAGDIIAAAAALGLVR